jgi:nicotinamidase-related amidase
MLSVVFMKNTLNFELNWNLCKDLRVTKERHGHRRKNDRSMLSKWWGELIMYGSEEWELIDGLDAAPEDIIDKNRYNAFHETDLDQRLQSAGIEDIIISGVMTNCCVETTARTAFDHDYGGLYCCRCMRCCQ